MQNVRVVLARVCKKCESINGGEKVILLDKKEVERRLKTDPDFHEYADSFHNSNYRSIEVLDSCRQC